MRTFSSLAIAVMVCLFSLNVFAAGGPKKATARNQATCTDDDGDGYCAADGTDEETKGWDCDDDNSSVHPGAKEIWDNGIDENCDGDDSETPPLSLLRAFHVSAGDHVGIIRLMKELAACDAASECHVDKSGGRLPSRMDEGHYFIDTNCDGVREVVDQAAKDKVDEDARKGIQCRKVPTSPVHHKVATKPKAVAVPLPGSATPTAAPAPTAPAPAPQGKGRGVKASQQVPAVDPVAVAKAQSTGDAALDKAGKAQATADEAKKLAQEQAELVKAAGAGLDGLKKDLTTETNERKADVAGLKIRLGNVEDKQVETGKVVSLLQRSGAFVQFGVGGGVIGQRPFGSSDAGVTSRGMAAYNVRFSGNVGVRTPKGSLGLFGVVAPTWDSGNNGLESGLAWQLGAEKLYRFGSLLVGGHVLYQEHKAGGSILEPNAISRGAGVGLTLASIGDDQVHGGVQLRATVGYEKFGGNGPAGFQPTVDGGAFAGLSLDLLAGLGSNSKPAKTHIAPPPPPPSPADEADEGEDTEGDEAADETPSKPEPQVPVKKEK